MQKNCLQCRADFIVTDGDIKFMEEMSPVFNGRKYIIPPPSLCPDCRQQQRVIMANQINLYHRKCDLTGQDMITHYHPDDPFKVYKQEVWFSDKWTALDFGRDFDFSRPFFEQFKELFLAVPKYNLQTGFQFDENSAYTNFAGKDKNCYLIFDSDENWDCFYSYSINRCKSSIDCYRSRSCELCYECLDCTSCYDCRFLQNCDNCTNSQFCQNCIGCHECLMCNNLKNKQYYVENKPVSKADFEAFKKTLARRPAIEAAARRMAELSLTFPQKYMHGVYNENVFGDYLDHCKNAQHCFDSSTLWDCKYVFQGFMPLKNCMDIQECGEAERLYMCAFTGYQAYNMRFCMHMLADGNDQTYCITNPHSKNCFGCVGLQHQEYCVFNKQYSKEEYEKLVGKIIEHMIKTGEYGQFYPLSFSPFPYNLTLAQEYFPLSKEEVLAKGLKWRDPDKKEYKPSTYNIPDTITGVPDSVVNETLACAKSGKNYRIVAKELELLRQMNIPLPIYCFETRHNERRKKRNSRKLFKRQCAKCGISIDTTYNPQQPEIVYCEKCYLGSIS